jgi:hypothetical protein
MASSSPQHVLVDGVLVCKAAMAAASEGSFHAENPWFCLSLFLLVLGIYVVFKVE